MKTEKSFLCILNWNEKYFPQNCISGEIAFHLTHFFLILLDFQSKSQGHTISHERLLVTWKPVTLCSHSLDGNSITSTTPAGGSPLSPKPLMFVLRNNQLMCFCAYLSERASNLNMEINNGLKERGFLVRKKGTQSKLKINSVFAWCFSRKAKKAGNGERGAGGFLLLFYPLFCNVIGKLYLFALCFRFNCDSLLLRLTI